MYVRSPVPHMLISLSPRFAYENAQRYWATAEKTHREVSESHFDYFYRKIAEVVKPRRGEAILDAGCGGGEITHAFQADGYKVAGFDSSEKLIERARARFGSEDFYVDDFMKIDKRDTKYSKVFVSGAFFYIHPSHYQRVLRNFYEVLTEGGKLYLLDNPDYAKRKTLYRDGFKRLFTSIFPVYDANNSGFWVKGADVARSAVKAGFRKVENVDSWAYYRSHIVLQR